MVHRQSPTPPITTLDTRRNIWHEAIMCLINILQLIIDLSLHVHEWHNDVVDCLDSGEKNLSFFICTF